MSKYVIKKTKLNLPAVKPEHNCVFNARIHIQILDFFKLPNCSNFIAFEAYLRVEEPVFNNFYTLEPYDIFVFVKSPSVDSAGY